MDSDIDGDELFSELKIVRKCLPKETKGAIEVLDYLKMMDSCFPNVWIAYRILLTIYTSYSCLCRKKFLKVEVNQIIHSINNVTRKIEWIGYTVY